MIGLWLVLGMLGMFCKIGLHRFKKIDKNIHHDFLICKNCGKRKFRFKDRLDHKYHWIEGNGINKETRKLITDWLSNNISFQEVEECLLKKFKERTKIEL